MNKENNIFKISNYDKFKCVADKCKFTCCEGWDISIDSVTYDKWKNVKGDSTYILKNVKKIDNKNTYLIKKSTYEACPFLDKKGLCYIVKNYGEGYLSSTCHMFPRIENIFDDRKELSLSCSCPEVVEIISDMRGKIDLYSDNCIQIENNLLEFKIRETLINIIKQEDFSLEYKLIICFEMLSSILEVSNLDNIILEEIEKYKDKDYIENIFYKYKEITLNIDESIEEINYLFLDIIQNYKEVPMFNKFLQHISYFSEEVEINVLASKWKEFKILFDKYNNLIENCILSKIISNCAKDNVEDTAISFQMIILNYLFIRYAVFLKYCIDNKEKIYIEDVKDYIVVFSRIIENNEEAVKEFLADGFGDVILEVGYLCFISLF